MHAQLHFFQHASKFEISGRVENGIAAQNNEHLDHAALHFICKLAQRFGLIDRLCFDRWPR